MVSIGSTTKAFIFVYTCFVCEVIALSSITHVDIVKHKSNKLSVIKEDHVCPNQLMRYSCVLRDGSNKTTVSPNGNCQCTNRTPLAEEFVIQEANNSALLRQYCTDVALSANKVCGLFEITVANESVKITCKYKEKETSAVINVACGPKFLESADHRAINPRDKYFSYLCPVPEGEPAPFIYHWYAGRPKNITLPFQKGRQLRLSSQEWLVEDTYTCVAINKLSKENDLFILRTTFTEEEPVYWVIAPAFLMVILIPIMYMVGEKYTGNAIKFYCCKGANRPQQKNQIKETTKGLSQLIVANLPISEDPTDLRRSQQMRDKRAEYLNDMNVTTSFELPSVTVRKKVIDRTSSEPTWIVEAIQKVEEWNEQLERQPESSTSLSYGSVDATSWQANLERNKARLIQSDVPRSKQSWMRIHGDGNREQAIHPLTEDDIDALADRLMLAYRYVDTDAEAFPPCRHIKDPFQSVIIRFNYPDCQIAILMWETYDEGLRELAPNAKDYDQLCNTIKERMLIDYPWKG